MSPFYFNDIFFIHILALCGGIISIGLAVFVYLKDSRSPLNRLWSGVSLCVGMWCLGAYFLLVSKNKDMALLTSRIMHFVSLWIPILQLHFTYYLLQLKRTTKKQAFLMAGYIFTFILVFSNTFYSLFILDVVKKPYFKYYPIPGPLYHFFTIIYFSYSIYWSYLLIKSLPLLSPAKRNQVKYVAIASIVGIIGGAGTFPLVYNIPFAPYTALFIPLYPLIISYAILRYRLMDIRLVLTRVSIFAVVYTFVLGIPFVLGVRFKSWLSLIAGGLWWLIPLGTMALLATIGPFIYIYLDKKAEERLFKRQRRYQDTLKQASLGMTRIRDLSKLLKLIVHLIRRTVKIEYAAIYLLAKEGESYQPEALRGSPQQALPKIPADSRLIKQLREGREPLLSGEAQKLSSLNASVVIPSFVEDTLIGFLALGDKFSGEIYSSDDLEVFTVLANQAALAIANASFFEESKEMQEQISQAEKMATIGTMADGLSHQINNRFHALALISGDALDSIGLTDTAHYSQEHKELLQELKYGLERVQDNVIQGGEVVKGMLKYTRKGDAGFREVSLDEIIDATLDMVKYKIKLNDIDIIRDYSKDIPKVKGNLTQLQEVFFNLIDNAYDAGAERKQSLKEQGYRARIRISTEYNNNGMLKINLEDNGIGVKEEDYKKLFTPFFTTKVANHKGTGLGLYVIRKIVADNHKGRIDVESRYKQGTKFKLELPAG